MGRKIRLGNCEDCDGFVLVDVAGDGVDPLSETCRHCGGDLRDETVRDVSVIQDDAGTAAAECDNCGASWPERLSDEVIDALGGCPACKPDAYGTLSADG